jgi:hypothetical protein
VDHLAAELVLVDLTGDDAALRDGMALGQLVAEAAEEHQR